MFRSTPKYTCMCSPTPHREMSFLYSRDQAQNPKGNFPVYKSLNYLGLRHQLDQTTRENHVGLWPFYLPAWNIHLLLPTQEISRPFCFSCEVYNKECGDNDDGNITVYLCSRYFIKCLLQRISSSHMAGKSHTQGTVARRGSSRDGTVWWPGRLESEGFGLEFQLSSFLALWPWGVSSSAEAFT